MEVVLFQRKGDKECRIGHLQLEPFWVSFVALLVALGDPQALMELHLFAQQPLYHISVSLCPFTYSVH